MPVKNLGSKVAKAKREKHETYYRKPKDVDLSILPPDLVIPLPQREEEYHQRRNAYRMQRETSKPRNIRFSETDEMALEDAAALFGMGKSEFARWVVVKACHNLLRRVGKHDSTQHGPDGFERPVGEDVPG